MYPRKVFRLYLKMEIVFNNNDQVDIVKAVQFQDVFQGSFRGNGSGIYFKLFHQEVVDLFNNLRMRLG